MRVVLVDPSRAVQHALTALVAHDGHEVVALCDGQSALACIRADASACVLLTSVQLPDISGLELCAAARAIAGSRRAIFIIVMSSSEDFALAVKALDTGADDFIHKPPIPEELRARLRAADRVTAMQRELIRYATTDSLTGLLTRRAFFEEAARLLELTKSGHPLAAILLDIDHFKSVNDSYGHETGDAVLIQVAATAKVISDGVVGRLGGEEFCMLVRGTMRSAVERAESMRSALTDLIVSKWNGGTVTCSFGVAEWQHGESIDALLGRADIGMYRAKNSGRDHVIAIESVECDEEHLDTGGVIRAGTGHR